MLSVRSAVEWKVSSLCRGDSVVVLAQREIVIVNTRFVFDNNIKVVVLNWISLIQSLIPRPT